MPLLSFIIPVRHQNNARDWGQLKANLAETLASISAQSKPDWRGYVAANHGADLPPLPERFEAVRVDFPLTICTISPLPIGRWWKTPSVSTRGAACWRECLRHTTVAIL
jgi:hypothetical protein